MHVKKSYAHVFQGECDEALELIQKAEDLMKDGWGSELLQVTIGFVNKKCENSETRLLSKEIGVEIILDSEILFFSFSIL